MKIDFQKRREMIQESLCKKGLKQVDIVHDLGVRSAVISQYVHGLSHSKTFDDWLEKNLWDTLDFSQLPGHSFQNSTQALGNAIVPKIATVLGQAILDYQSGLAVLVGRSLAPTGDPADEGRKNVSG